MSEPTYEDREARVRRFYAAVHVDRLLNSAHAAMKVADDEQAELRARLTKAEAERDTVTHLLGSHADGHRCTCTIVREADYYGYFGPTPAEWEQDPWCPTHPDVDYISAKSREAMARLDRVETLPDEWEGEADANETHPKESRTLLSAAAELRTRLEGQP